jgi:long-chain acyl-CoA synthetase
VNELRPPEVAGLYGLCQRAAREWPAVEGLRHGPAAMTFAEWDTSARAVAALLAAEGVRPGDTVALWLENSLEYAVILFGIFAAGAVAVPLNADSTPEAASYVVEHASPKLVVARSRTVGRLHLKGPGVRILELGAGFAENQERCFSGVGAAPVSRNPEDLAMLLYTSGTTGKPKGVMLTHGNLQANTESIVEYLGLSTADSIVTVLPFFHSFGNSVLLTHLAAGARLVIENRFAFPNQVVETLIAEGPTGFAGVPATYYILLHRSTFAQHKWGSFRYICQAGGGMRVETIRKLRELLPGAAIVVMYGQTEASARLSYLPPERLEDKVGSIGIAIPGVELRVVNPEGAELPVGVTGELVARGPNIMAGYLGDEEATAQALRGGWLFTGDMGYRDEDGFFFLVARKSDFIKSASYRVGPAEIEEVIGALAGVEDVAAIGVEDELLGEAIAVCVVCPPEVFDAGRIRGHCLERLPLYKVPKHVLHVTEIPRTPSGKKQYFLLREKYRFIGSPTANA